MNKILEWIEEMRRIEPTTARPDGEGSLIKILSADDVDAVLDALEVAVKTLEEIARTKFGNINFYSTDDEIREHWAWQSSQYEQSARQAKKSIQTKLGVRE